MGLLDSGEQLCGVPLLHRPRGATGTRGVKGLLWGSDGQMGLWDGTTTGQTLVSAEGSLVLMMDVGEHDGTVSQGTLGPGDVAYWGKVGGRLPFGLRFGGSSSQSRDSPEINAVLSGKTLTS